MAKQEIKAGVGTVRFPSLKYRYVDMCGNGEYRIYLSDKDYIILNNATPEQIIKLRKLLGG